MALYGQRGCICYGKYWRAGLPHLSRRERHCFPTRFFFFFFFSSPSTKFLYFSVPTELPFYSFFPAGSLPFSSVGPVLSFSPAKEARVPLIPQKQASTSTEAPFIFAPALAPRGKEKKDKEEEKEKRGKSSRERAKERLMGKKDSRFGNATQTQGEKRRSKVSRALFCACRFPCDAGKRTR